ncbi:molybdate ABC transporter substrate-binding protein [Microcoleus sp. FACHB-672]|uniref:molybdate ABC transporter substrate-binding protein n=1 Tax=Microcoleus sp. FACHB-672 TaxID=2692825 RepID=UPI0016841EA1|nr:molybdate ABC transporter substrate-binding protein [Microcoleus sp. FACHB-672]MBD2044024.1 molybdate ABC transporter substrate-binding protein [Microcoleus sp. FACHB-672]
MKFNQLRLGLKSNFINKLGFIEIPKIFILFVCIIICIKGLTSCTLIETSSALTVSAAASLKESLEEIQEIYTKDQPSASLIYNFGASGALQQQIEQGAPVDIFISASPQQMDALHKKGLLISETRKNLLKNQLVLVEPKNSPSISDFKDLASERVKKIALGEPQTVPVGKYAQEVLSFFQIADKVKPKVVFAKDVRQVLTYVERGDVDAGIVYKTDAIQSARVKIVADAPAQSHSPVIYSAAVIKDSKNIPKAKEFVEFLASNRAASVFRKYGFTIPAGESGVLP